MIGVSFLHHGTGSAVEVLIKPHANQAGRFCFGCRAGPVGSLIISAFKIIIEFLFRVEFHTRSLFVENRRQAAQENVDE